MPSGAEWVRNKLIEQKKIDFSTAVQEVYKMYPLFKSELNLHWTYKSYRREVDRQNTKLKESSGKTPDNTQYLAEINYLKKVLKQLHRRKAVEDKLVDVISEIAIQYTPHESVMPITISDSTNKRSATLVISDWHLDEKVDLGEMFGINEFDWEIAEQRVAYLFNTAIATAIELNCSEMVFLILGDILSGVIHEDLIYASEIGMTPSVIRTFDLIAKYIEEASKYFEVRVACASGNHSRITDKKYFNKTYTFNLEWLLYEFLRRELSEITVSFQNSTSPFDYIIIQDYYFLYLHGNIIPGGNNLANIPAITMSRDMAKINGAIRTKYIQDKMQNKVPTVPPRIDYIVTAHFHSEFNLPGFDAVPIIGNGSLIGGNAFSLQTVKAANRPMQKFFVVEEGKGIRFQDSIYLDCI